MFQERIFPENIYKQNARVEGGGRRFKISPIDIDIEDKSAGKQTFGVAAICR